MVRTVQVDEAVQQYADQQMLKRAEAEVIQSLVCEYYFEVGVHL
jgi:hypothetical protein